MNYEKIYYAIINKALRKERTGQRWKCDGNYYEKHHIKPRSLNGSDENNNLVLLTAKEHYLCHWLLVKSYKKDTIERKKMLKAWFMMASIGDTGRPTISMRDYEKYKMEFGTIMSELQVGNNNSQFGMHWYTDLETGNYIKAKEPPYKHYILGKNWFNSKNNRTYNIKSSALRYMYNKTNNIIKRRNNAYIEYIDDNLYNKMSTKERRQFANKIKKEQTFMKNQKICQKLWDEYHSLTYNNFKEFIIKHHPELKYGTISDWLKKYIPYYKEKILNGNYKIHKFLPDINLIGIYEG
jgi:hypothetical protein